MSSDVETPRFAVSMASVVELSTQPSTTTPRRTRSFRSTTATAAAGTPPTPAASNNTTTANAATAASMTTRAICFRFIIQKLHRLFTIITYPFILLFTTLSLILIVTFCILPTIFCMTLGICAYYCFMEDPIPLNLLLRYMFSPDNDNETGFGSGAAGDRNYSYGQNRNILLSKLIVRKLTKITATNHDIIKSNDGIYPRNYLYPMHIITNNAILDFSEPLVFKDETNDDDDDDDGTNKQKNESRHRITEEENGDSQIQNAIAENNDIGHVSYYQGSAERQLSSLPLEESDPDSALMERDESVLQWSRRSINSESDIAIGNQRRASSREIMWGGEDDSDDGSNDDEEEEVQINVGRRGNEDLEDIEECCDRDGTEDTPHISQHDHTISQDNEKSLSKDQSTSKNAADDSPVSPSSQAQTQTDYFGIADDNMHDRGTTCDICLLEYEVGDEIAWSPNIDCCHTYHKDCILDWLVRKPTCPNCRHDYLKGNNKKDEKWLNLEINMGNS